MDTETSKSLGVDTETSKSPGVDTATSRRGYSNASFLLHRILHQKVRNVENLHGKIRAFVLVIIVLAMTWSKYFGQRRPVDLRTSTTKSSLMHKFYPNVNNKKHNGEFFLLFYYLYIIFNFLLKIISRIIKYSGFFLMFFYSFLGKHVLTSFLEISG